ncbi:MAG: branched-chain amino acid ABC transporter permease [Gemmatimonadetes bacterium]|nr:branched-chain amino acid ABC transporter permease [Gemmatimonadota bacterium]
MNYLLYLVTIFALAAMQTAGWSLVVGLCGIPALNGGLLVGVGAYVYALLATTLTPAVALGSAIAAGLVAGWLTGLLAYRLSSEWLVLGTLAIQLAGTTIIANLDGVTGGLYGITAIPRPSFSGRVMTNANFALLALAAAVVALGVVRLWYTSPFARALRAGRDTPADVVHLGRSLSEMRRAAFACAGAVLAPAGALAAAHATYIDPSTGDLSVSIALVAAVVLGGSGRLSGALAGAAVITLLPELLRFSPLAAAPAAAVQQAIFGVLLVACIRWKPNGLLGEHSYGFVGAR